MTGGSERGGGNGPAAGAAGPGGVDLDRVWLGVAAEVWRRRPGWLERLAGRLLRSPGLARALVTTPSLLLGWVTVGFAFAFFVPEDVFPVSYARGGKSAHLDLGGARGEAIVAAVRDQLGKDPAGQGHAGGGTRALENGNGIFFRFRQQRKHAHPRKCGFPGCDVFGDGCGINPREIAYR